MENERNLGKIIFFKPIDFYGLGYKDALKISSIFKEFISNSNYLLEDKDKTKYKIKKQKFLK